MADLAARIGISIDSGAARSGANSVIAEYNRIISGARPVAAANDNIGKSLDLVGKKASGAASGSSAVARAFDDIRGRAAGAVPAVGGLVNNLAAMGPMAAIVGGVALALAAIGTAAIKAAAQTQGWLAQIETITKSSEKAKETYAAAVQFANTTPFDTGQSVQAVVKLRQMGLAATEERLKSFGNTASASGKSLNQMIEAVADAATGEFERLKEFGIKSKVEGDKVRMTFQGVTTSIANNSVAITKYLENIGNTAYAGAMAKQMAGLNGMFANVADSARSMLSAIGEGQLGKAVAAIGNRIAQGVSGITPFLAAIGNAVGGIISGVGAVVDGLAQVWMGFGQGTTALSILDGLTIGFNLVAQGVQTFGNIVGSVLGAVGSFASQVSSAIGLSFGGVLDWLGIKFETGGRSWANSIVGTLRAAKTVAGLLPQLFGIAINEVIRMFSNLGNIMKRVLSGESIGDIAAGTFKQTIRGINAVGRIAAAVQGDVKGADAAIGRLRGQTVAPKWDSGTDSKPDPSGKKDDKKDKGKSEAEKLKERIDDFWKKLEGDNKDADALWKALQQAAAQGKNLAVVSADVSKQLEYQRLVGRDITQAERQRIETAQQMGRTAKFFSDQLVKSAERTMDLSQQEALLAVRKYGASDAQLAVEKAILDNRETALKAGVDLTSAAYRAQEAALRTDVAREQAIKAQNAALDDQASKLAEITRTGASYARDALRDYGNVAQRRGVAQGEYDDRMRGLRAARDSTGADKISAAQFEAGAKRAGEELQERFRDIGTEFANRMNKVANLLGRIGSAIGGRVGEAVDGIGNVARGIGDFGATKDGVSAEFQQLFAKNSDLVKGIGNAVGGAVGGLQISESITSLGKTLGIKLNETGSKIGGALGGMVGGPVGSIVGSIAGGLIGNLFTKPKYGTAQLTGAGDPTLSGRGKGQKKIASGAAGSVQEGIANLAEQLGGQVGKYLVSIGTYDGKWRVSTSGQTGEMSFGKKNKSKSTLVDFGDDQAAAIAFAIQDAIKDGAITGLSDIVQKALSGLGSDAAIQFAQDWTSAMDDFKSIIDPVGSAIDAVTKPLDALRKTMTTIGASSSDLAKLEEYRGLKMKAALEEQTSGFRDLLKSLNGDAGGVTALNQLNSSLSEFEKYRTDIAAGKTVDQSKFVDLASSIANLNGQVNGSNTTDFQSIVSMLKTATNGAVGLVEAKFNPAQAAQAQIDAMKDASNAALANSDKTNDYLSQILITLQNNSVIDYSTRGNIKAIDGRMNNAY